MSPGESPSVSDRLSAGESVEMPLSEAERRSVLSSARLKLKLIVFVVAVLIALSGLMFLGVKRIFDWLTPTIGYDLQHKASHAASELAQSTQLGIVVRDPQVVHAALGDYVSDPDVVGIMVRDATGSAVYQRGAIDPRLRSALQKQPEGKAIDFGNVYGSWMPSEIEGAHVGDVAITVSKARLDAGLELRRDVLLLAGVGSLVALLACLAFVSLYIGPILRITSDAFLRLERTTEAALVAARLKSQFLANMSHEIRTPMNGILGVVDLLEHTALNATQERYVKTIDASARSLLTIINDILDFSKLEAGKYQARVDDFEPHQVVQEVAELLAPKADAKKLDLIVRTDANVPSGAGGDADRIRQVLLNLVGNAIKFTEQGSVTIRTSFEPQTPDSALLRFAVSDTGAGISAKDQALLFGVFSQVDGSLTRKHGGTGLGLAISKRLAEAMGGEIGVESEPGRGSTFWFTVRVKPSLDEAPSDFVSRSAKVLLATRSEAQASSLRELIERWGMVCEVVNQPERGVERVLEQPGGFNVAVIDGSIAESDEMLADLCMTEAIPVLRLLSPMYLAEHGPGESQHKYLRKPVRVSELYNGIIGLLDGVTPFVPDAEVANTSPASIRPQRGRVLVVDDNEINRLVAVDLLASLGYETDTACDGGEAVAKASQTQYSAILMDCQMPGLDGYQATAEIRKLPGPLAKVPIIALTAHAMADDRDLVLRAGMDDYASKPIRERVLERLLRRWVPSNPPIGRVGTSQSMQMRAVDVERQVSSSERPVTSLEEPALLDPSLPRPLRVVELFLSTTPPLVAALSQAVASREVAQVKQLAHKLKGSSLSLGAGRLAAACHAVELAARGGSIDVDAFARIPVQLAAVTPLLTALLERQPANDVTPSASESVRR